MRMRLLPATIAIGGLLLVSKSLSLAIAYLPPGWALGVAVVPVAIAAPEPAHADKPDAKAADPKPAAPVAGPTASSEPQPPPISEEERRLL